MAASEWQRVRAGLFVLALGSLLTSCGSPTTGSVKPNQSDGDNARSGSPDGGTEGDAAVDDGICDRDGDCSDGVYCNGVERCAPDHGSADTAGCVPGPPACSDGQRCDEEVARCVTECAVAEDADGDGHKALECGGDDCDDADPNRYPQNVEVCDIDNHDEDCLPRTFAIQDLDADGEPDAACCNFDDEGNAYCGTDCDDTRSMVNPNVPEVCDGLDNDCDENIDEEVLETFYPDEDGDGFGTADPEAETVVGCFVPPGYSDLNTDCDDTDAAVNPGNPELCDVDGVDEDCDGEANPAELCSCTGTEARDCLAGGVCAAGVEQCADGVWGACSIAPVGESCNELDDDCDGMTDEDLTATCYPDDDNDGFAASGALPAPECPVPGRTDVGGCPAFTTNLEPVGTDVDCNDDFAPVRPDAAEACNYTDDDCDGQVDEGVSIVCYADNDGDTYADGLAPAQPVCAVGGRDFVGGCPAGTTNRQPVAGEADCDDGNSAVNPAGSETCNGLDDDCSGTVDDGVQNLYVIDDDGDGFGSDAVGAETQYACFRPAGFADNADDCDDGSSGVNPGLGEVCDAGNVDENCDGVANPSELCSCTGAETRACNLPGVCSNGVETCSDGEWGECSVAPANEACNGLDDDCDGGSDEALTVQCYADDDNDGYPEVGATGGAECPAPSRVDVGGCPAFTTDREPLGANLDCNDGSAAIRPGTSEACNAIDDDCDGQVDEGVAITCYQDNDGDTFPDTMAVPQPACTVAGRDFVGGCPVGSTNRQPLVGSSDCNDGNSAINPSATERCNALDDDCDSITDENVQTLYFEDDDGDGFGSSEAGAMMVYACFPPEGYATSNSDCDDGSSAVNPGLGEQCDAGNVDENCDGIANPVELCSCVGSETRACQLPGVCANGVETCSDGAWGDCSISPAAEACDGLDNDCDGGLDEGLRVVCYSDDDNDGYPHNSAVMSLQCPAANRVDVGGCPAFTTDRQPLGADLDCDDTSAATRPGAVEACNILDDDCDGSTDEGVAIICYADSDGDTYAHGASAALSSCAVVGRDFVGGCPSGSTNRQPVMGSADCDDTNSATNPAGTEQCNGIDDDCSGQVDEGVQTTFYQDADGDGFGSDDPGALTVDDCFVPDGYAASASDCDDSESGVNPGVGEVCDVDNVDENCDGEANPTALCSCVGSETRSCQLPGTCAAGVETCGGGTWGDCSIAPVTEACNGSDEDCDGQTDEQLTVACFPDGDNDGFAATGAASSPKCPDSGRVEVGGCPAFFTNRAPLGLDIDCDDTKAARRPNATESCNVVDDDCDGATDEGVVAYCYVDGDSDTYALLSATQQPTCPVAGREEVGGCPSGFTNRTPVSGADCDDTRSAVNPAGAESCNGLNDDCDGATDEGVQTLYTIDSDGDGFGSEAGGASTQNACTKPPGYVADATDCNDANTGVNPGVAEICDAMMVDENCDGSANPTSLCSCSGNESRVCAQPGVCAAGTQTCQGGAWSSCSIAPTAETCNGLDDNCNGATDEGLTVLCYDDFDNDGYPADGAAFAQRCPDPGRVAVGGCPANTTNRAPAGVDIDCDDGNAARRPGATESCNNVDDDCDGAVDDGVSIACWADNDGDTYAAGSALQQASCPVPGREVVGGCGANLTNRQPADAATTDCADNDSAVNPSQTEVCNGKDDDCANGVDDGVLTTFYEDDDSDGYGSDAVDAISVQACFPPAGFEADSLDCDDSESGVNPGVGEVCDAAMVDENCDGIINPPEDCACNDGESQPCAKPGICASGTEMCSGGAWGACSITENAETCNGLDDNCNGATDEGLTVTCYPDLDNDGFSAGGESSAECPDPGRTAVGGCPTFTTNLIPFDTDIDCDDSLATVRPNATDICNLIDDDCDGSVDEGVSVQCYTDNDGDTYSPNGSLATPQCPVPGRESVGGCPVGTTNRPPAGAEDCNDGASGVNPGAQEMCEPERVDDDCDGVPNQAAVCECDNGDERACADAMGVPEVGACAAGIQSCIAGNWSACSVQPAPEVCNGADDNCNGSIDEGVTVDCYIDGDDDTFPWMSASVTAVCPAPGRGTVGGCPFGLTNVPPMTAVDCNDNNASINPDGLEVCDAAMNDEDCDGVANPAGQCACVDGMTENCPPPGSRCADGTRMCMGGGWGPCTISAITEICNGEDDDCDGAVDDGVTVTCYDDTDDDTYPDPNATPQVECPVGGRDQVGGCPSGLTDVAPGNATVDDCDDTDPNVNPGEAEICDGVKNHDCDGYVADLDDTDCDCINGSSISCAALTGATGACAAGSHDCNSGSWGTCSVSPTTEVCNGVNDDCDGQTDEFVATICYQDQDQDGYAATGAATQSQCGGCPNGWTQTQPTTTGSSGNIDCRENDGYSYPGASERCDRIDNNCSSGGGVVSSEDSDGDGFTAEGFTGCSGGFDKTDCRDNNSDVRPTQGQYFATGYCPVNAPCTCGNACAARILLNNKWVCPFCPSNGSVPRSFDYNCDDAETGQPTANCRCSGLVAQTCIGDGPKYSSSCGATVIRTNCFGFCPGGCSGSDDGYQAYGCR